MNNAKPPMADRIYHRWLFYDVADIVFPRVNRVGRFLKKDDVIAVNELLKLVFAIGINDKGAFAVEAEGYGF